MILTWSLNITFSFKWIQIKIITVEHDQQEGLGPKKDEQFDQHG